MWVLKMNVNHSRKNLSILEVGDVENNGDYSCEINNLTSLLNSPKIVTGSFSCAINKLSNLEFGPISVFGFYSCHSNDLTSLSGSPKFVGGLFFAHDNLKLLNLSDIWESKIQQLNLGFNSKMAVLPVVKFKVRFIDEETLSVIVNRHRGSSKQNIIDCQYDLIENGYADNAKWKP